jgi:hypothetical protein
MLQQEVVRKEVQSHLLLQEKQFMLTQSQECRQSLLYVHGLHEEVPRQLQISR